MRSARKAVLAGAGAALLLYLPAFAQEAATTREREALSSRNANRSVQRDLLSILKPVRKIDSGMFRRLREVELTTEAFGTKFDGLCRRDAVTLWYAETAAAAKPEDAPVRPYSVESRPLFHVAYLARKGPSEVPEGGNVWQARCSSADTGDGAGWFEAEDAQTAIQGALMLEAAVDDVRSGKLRAEPCPGIFDPKKATCESTILAHGSISEIDSVETCPSNAGSLCYVVDLASSTRLTIKGRAEGTSLVPDAITSVAVEQYIIVT